VAKHILKAINKMLFPSKTRILRIKPMVFEECFDGDQKEAAREICNFLALMTDMDALRLHSLLRGSKASSVFDFI
jgi:dGTP triphosphohydrolase